MTRARCLFAFSLFWCIQAQASNWVLTVESESSFRRLMEDAEAGGLGADIRDALIRIDGEVVHVTLFSRSGHDLVATLGRPASGEPKTSPRFFSITSTGPEEARVQLVATLDRYFPSTPWMPPLDLTETRNENSLTTKALSMSRPALIRVSPRALLGILVFLTAALLTSLYALWRLRPEES